MPPNPKQIDERRERDALGVLGSVLRERRLRLNLKGKDVADAIGVTASMVRMVEAGLTYVPAERASAYATVLNLTSDEGAPKLDPTALAEAYTAVRVYAAGDQPASTRHPWLQLLDDAEKAKTALINELLPLSATLPPTETRDLHDLRGVLASLHPVQLQLVQEVASRVQAFVGDLLSDENISEWEQANAPQLACCWALVSSLGSEHDAAFQRSIARTLATGRDFDGYRYLVAADGTETKQVRHLWEKLSAQVREQVKGFGSRDRKANSGTARFLVEKKFQCRTVSLHDFQRLIDHLTREVQGDGWESLYLYTLRTGQSLLIGVFRRVPAMAPSMPRKSLESWGTHVINQALPWRLVKMFVDEHKRLWNAPDKGRK